MRYVYLQIIDDGDVRLGVKDNVNDGGCIWVAGNRASCQGDTPFTLGHGGWRGAKSPWLKFNSGVLHISANRHITALFNPIQLWESVLWTLLMNTFNMCPSAFMDVLWTVLGLWACWLGEFGWLGCLR